MPYYVHMSSGTYVTKYVCTYICTYIHTYIHMSPSAYVHRCAQVNVFYCYRYTHYSCMYVLSKHTERPR